MSGQQVYKLSIEAILPKKVIEDKIFSVTYRVKNIDSAVFPGGDVIVLANLPENVGIVRHPIQVKQLQVNEYAECTYSDMRAIAGFTVFVSAADSFRANNGGTIELYLVDGRKMVKGQLFSVIRARANEEVSSSLAVQIAAVSLVILIIIQIADWFIRYYWKF